MTRNGVAVAALGLAIFTGLAERAVAQDAPRPTIAIADIAVRPGGWTLPPPQMGNAIVDMLLGELVGSQQFHIYDGQWLVPQDEAGGRVDIARLRQAAAERHVDYLVLGSVTEFTMVQTRNRGGGLIPLHTAGGIGGVSINRSQLAVALNFRVVDVRTGEIVATAAGQGTGARKSGGLALLGVLRALPLPLAAVGAHSVINAREAMLDDALKHAVHDAALALTSRQLPVTSHQ